MKRMLLMIASIIPMSFIFNGRDFFNSIAGRYLGQSDEGFGVLFNCNLFGFVNLQDVSLQYVLYTMTIFVAYLFMFGHFMSDNLNVSDIYVFIRENKRTKWFVKESAAIFLQSTVVAIVNIAIVYFMTNKMSIERAPTSIKQIAGIAVLTILYIWILAIATNFFSALFGSTIGLSVGAALHYVFVIIASYGYDTSIIKSVDPLAVVFNVAEGRQSIISAVIIMSVILAIVCAVFCIYVNKADISLKNKEIIM